METFSGQVYHRLEPPIERDFTLRRKAEHAVRRFASTRAADELERQQDADEPEGIGDIFDRVVEILLGENEVTEDDIEDAKELSTDLLPEQSGYAARVREAVAAWVDDLQPVHPNKAVLDRLWPRRPHFAMFAQPERDLASDYDVLEVANDPPAALLNLALIAGLDLPALAEAIRAGDSGRYVSMTEAANATLQTVFSQAWQQSIVTVRLHLDANTLRVMVSNEGGGYSTIAERSDGLKAFVALTAFAAQEELDGRPMILLIDEAEQHLHYDAQADLVRMLDRQGLARQVIYTTHSSGCLPADLGTGIRPVVPDAVGGRSKILNSFWGEARGFQPLLMALGAGAASYAPSRYAVLSEGASDMLLIPSLIREATGSERLDYQVAPGIAETAGSQLMTLELEAPRVAYLLDGDAGGDQHKKRLMTGGITASHIVQLGGNGSGLTTEDLLLEDVYLAAVNETLERVHGGGHGRLGPEDLPLLNRSKGVDAWCKTRGLALLAKPAVASVLLEQGSAPALADFAIPVLVKVHTTLCAALAIPVQ